MQFSLNALKKYLLKHYEIDLNDINQSHQISDQYWLEGLTMQGLEVEDEIYFPKLDDKIIVGQVIKIEPHPNADRLRICHVKTSLDETSLDETSLDETSVDESTALLQIVCGATNVVEKAYVCVATNGTILSLADDKSLTIAPVVMRGVESYGMLCSASELGFTKELQPFLGIDDIADNGLLLLNDAISQSFIGKPVHQLLDLDDIIVTIKLTPNRGDCLSLQGLAREINALVLQLQRKSATESLNINTNINKNGQNNKLSNSNIDIENNFTKFFNSNHQLITDSSTWSNKCHVFAIAHLKIAEIRNQENRNLTTPLWLKQALNRFGVRSISLIVDCANWVMLETGQPLHTYDASKIQLPFTPRSAKSDEEITLLNQNVIKFGDLTNFAKLNPLIIADNQKPVALAGIMGGLDTQIDERSTEIFVEAANFTGIRGMDYQLNSDAVFRFERGVDPLLVQKSLVYFYELLNFIINQNNKNIDNINNNNEEDNRIIWVAGQYMSNNGTSTNNTYGESTTISLDLQKIEKRIGFSFNHQEALENLASIGIHADLSNQEANNIKTNNIILNIPSYRFDLKNNDDLSEEVLRQVGYEHIPTQLPERKLKVQSLPFHVKRRRFIKEKLSQLGFQETIHLSFTNNDDAQKNGGVALTNPMVSHHSHLRGHLLSHLLQTWKQHIQSQIFQVKIFEYSRVFKGHSIKEQPYIVAGLWAGSIHHNNGVYWNDAQRYVMTDFYHLKGELEQLFPALDYHAISDDVRFHPTRCAGLFYQGKQIGVMGELHPLQLNQLGIAINKQIQTPILFELNIEAYPVLELLEERHQVHEFSRFPRIEKDMAFLLKQEVQWGDVVDHLEQYNELDYVQGYQLFDEFIAKNDAENQENKDNQEKQKSWAIRMSLQAVDRTLTDAEIHNAMNQCITIMNEHHQGILRDGK